MLQNRHVHTTCLKLKRFSSTTLVILKSQLPAAAYQPEIVEKNKYKSWEVQKCFVPDCNIHKPTFSMVLPPPNVTGKLHLGHALGCTIQDVIARRQRSLGKDVLWLPGTDHAGIATQRVVEKYLMSTMSVTRLLVGRDHFMELTRRWKQKYGNTITEQLRTLGCSLDWTREWFTMNEAHTHAVNNAFIKLFSKGLIYRKKAIVNWCPALNSTVSDIEIENLEIKGPTNVQVHGMVKPVKFGLLYSFAYKIEGVEEEIVVSTTMPETMLGDVAVAIHPEDKRYWHFVGKRLIHPFRAETIPIIVDDFVDMKFGTGAVKITPAHSKVDYDVAKRHNLQMRQVIDESGKMINSNMFSNLQRYDCRTKIVEELKKLGYMRKIEEHNMILPTCSRTGDVIEYLPKEQWFVSCSKMNKRAREAVTSGRLKLEPEKYVKNWLNWTNDDRDWCISRQLWWGHQIPAYKCTTDKHVVWVAAMSQDEAKIIASSLLRTYPVFVDVQRDPDVLDTWFSSGIYPFASLGWPNETVDFEKFYPLNLLATGHDILGFWVHRMVMLGLELTDKLPFNEVLLHGIICDNKGAKMSKSKGNVIDPMYVIQGISMEDLKKKAQEMHKTGNINKAELQKALSYHKANFSNTNGIPECGVDALRFTLLSQDVKSHFVSFDISMCHANKLFCNKIWQSIKYTEKSFLKLPHCFDEIGRQDLTYFDRWILSRMADMVEKVNKYMDSYDFHLATKALRTHIYNEFCDTYLEATKPGLSSNNLIKVGYAHCHTLSAVLNTSLRCLSPFMVYLTEEVISKIPGFQRNIIVNYSDETKPYFDFPQPEHFETWKNITLEDRVGKFLDAVRVIRKLKSLCGMSNKLRPSIYVKTKDEILKQDLTNNLPVLLNLVRCCTLDFQDFNDRKFIRSSLDEKSEVWVEVMATDIESTISNAKNKLEQDIIKVEKNLQSLDKKFRNEKTKETSSNESAKGLDIEKLMNKKDELKRLQMDLDTISRT